MFLQELVKPFKMITINYLITWPIVADRDHLASTGMGRTDNIELDNLQMKLSIHRGCPRILQRDSPSGICLHSA